MKDENYILEYEIIGSLINDPSTLYLVNKLQSDDFIDANNMKIISCIKELANSNQDVTIFSIHNRSNISISEIANRTATVATTANIEANIRVLKEISNKRRLNQKLNIIRQQLIEPGIEFSTIRNNLFREVEELEELVDEEVISLRDAMVETSLVLDARYNSRNDTSYMTGITKLDMITAGLHKEELTTIGARPGVGKTILGMQIGIKIAMNKRKVMYTSLEMSVTQLCERIISSNTDTDSQRLRTGKIQDHEWELITKASSRYSFDNFLIDKSSRNPQHIRTKLRKHKPDLLIIDYLQLLQSSSKENTREREVATITRDLKLMSLEFGIPIIILSQLNRNAEGNRPSMADLRESGAIEQDSDNIIFIHEPLEVERTKLINEGKFTRDFFDKVKAEGNRFSQLIIEKQRNGPVGTLEVLKVPKLMKFIDVGK
jgi:replicative DNA helicase